MQDAELLGEFRRRMHHREGQALQVGMGLAPGEMRELVVRAAAQHLRIALPEVGVALGELRDLGRADEGEVFGPEEQHEPLLRIERVCDAEALQRIPPLTNSIVQAHSVRLVGGPQNTEVSCKGRFNYAACAHAHATLAPFVSCTSLFYGTLTRSLVARLRATGTPPGGLCVAMVGAGSPVHATGTAPPLTCGDERR